MENILSLTSGQQLFILGMYTWIFIIFPVLILRKLNHITQLLEVQVYGDDEDEEGSIDSMV